MTSYNPLKKNAIQRIVFPILDADGDPVASAAGLDSERSIDGGVFSDCMNEAIEIGNGVYYLDLTADETNGDVICIVVKTSTEGAKSTVLVFYTSATPLADIGAKLPTNYIMGSSVQTDKDDEIDAIKAKTDNLPASPAPANEYDTQLDANMSTRAPEAGGNVAAIKNKTDNLPASPAPASEYDTQMGRITANVATEAKQDVIDGIVDDIKLKTENLPDDPADDSDIDGQLANIQTDLETVKKINMNRWKITGNQLTIYDDDGVTPLHVFDLKDSGGDPAMENVYERVPT